jgi:hypothetical protein
VLPPCVSACLRQALGLSQLQDGITMVFQRLLDANFSKDTAQEFEDDLSSSSE